MSSKSIYGTTNTGTRIRQVFFNGKRFVVFDHTNTAIDVSYNGAVATKYPDFVTMVCQGSEYKTVSVFMYR